MASFKVSSFLCIFLLINYSMAVLNNFDNKNKNVDVERLCVGGDVIHKSDKILKPVVVAAENVSAVEVNGITGIIEGRSSIISSEYELPFQSSDNHGPFYTLEKSSHSFDLQLPEVFSPYSEAFKSISQFGSEINAKRLQFGTHYTPTIFPHHNNRMKSLNFNTIPTSLEAYGPPINELFRPYFSSSSSRSLLPRDHNVPPAPLQIQNDIHGDITSNVGIFAPPTPSDIKYDGWKPIQGHFSSPNHLLATEHSIDEHEIPSLSTNNNFALVSDSMAPHSARQLSEIPTAIPSNSYGDPINNTEDHNLKQSVRQSQISDGLPPPPIPEREPFHVNQGPTKMIFSTSAPSVADIINDDLHQNGLEPLSPPNIDDSLPGLFHPQSIRGQLQYNNNNYGSPSDNGLLLQQLPSLNSGPFTTLLDSPDELGTSYLTPPPSSFSSSGPYPLSRRPSYLVDPLRKPFKLTNSGNRNIPKFMYRRNRGTFRTQLKFPTASLITDFIPPRSSPHVNFYRNISPQLPSNLILKDNPLSIKSLVSTGIHDSTFGNSFTKNYQYSPNFDSHGSSSSDQPQLTVFTASNQSNLHDNSEQTNKILPGTSNYELELGGNGDIKSSSTDAFGNFHHENSEAARALVQALSLEHVSSKNIQIQDSKDRYTFQMESRDGGQKMENTDGTVRHEQILSERLLHDIIMAIEQPRNSGNVQVVSFPPVQSLHESHERSDEFKGEQTANQLDENSIYSPTIDNHEETELSSDRNNAAFFSNNHYEKSINKNEITSTFRKEKVNGTNPNS